MKNPRGLRDRRSWGDDFLQGPAPANLLSGSTMSRPFPPPETGKIAVKVINHYGDEVLKVFKLA